MNLCFAARSLKRLFPLAGIALALSLSPPTAHAQLLYGHTVMPTGKYTTDVASADLNGDGRADVVATNDSDNKVSVMIRNGDGTFKPQVTYPTGASPQAVVITDINGDGKLDIITANYSGNSVSVLLGNGNGTFQNKIDYGTGTGTVSVAFADVDGDGLLDIVTANQTGNSVSILLNYGNITFQTATNYATASTPVSVAIGDFNGDSKPDIVTANNNSTGNISVLANNGAGAFPAHTEYATLANLHRVTVADINGDGKLDILTANNNGTISVLLNTTSGSTITLATHTDYTVGNNPQGIVATDLNGDGKPDVVVANYGDNTISVLLNNGAGSLLSKVNYNVGLQPLGLKVVDVNGDDKKDIVVANYGNSNFPGLPGSVSLLPGNGDGTFQSNTNYATGKYPQGVASADLNKDGKADLVVANSNDSTISVLLSAGDGSFTPQVTYSVGNTPTNVVLVDVNGDGKLDAVVTNYGDNTVSVLFGNGSGGFVTRADYTVNAHPYGIAIADINGDNKPDLIVACYNNSFPSAGSLTVLLNNSNGTYASGVQINTSAKYGVVAGDVNGDGFLDIVAQNNNGIEVYLNKGDGTFNAPIAYTSSGSSSGKLMLGDLNGDGKLDLVVANGSLYVMLNRGNGTFLPEVKYTTSRSAGTFTLTDVNGDGKLDVVVTTGERTVDLLFGNGDGTFRSNQAVDGVGSSANSVAVGDFNGDGKPDIAVTSYDIASVAVLLNNGFGRLASLPRLDLNNDGKNDLLLQNSATGAVYYWLLNGNTLGNNGTIWAGGDVNWKLIATPDINGDGKSDALLQYQANGSYPAGSIFAWQLNGTAIAKATLLWNSTDPNWKLVTTANLKGDSNAYALLQYATTGAVYYWKLNPDFTIGLNGYIWSGNIGDYKIVGTPDLNGDGRPDLLLQSASTGQVYYWIMNTDLTVASSGYVYSGNLSQWTVVGTPDLNGDGRPDILLQNKVTGAVYYWLMGGTNGTTIGLNGTIWAGGDVNWKLVSVTDLTNSGKVSLVFQYATTGAVYYWNLNALTIGQQGYLFSGSLTGWNVVAPR